MGSIKTILVIDDEKMITEALAAMLTSEGYAVITESDGWEALKKFNEAKESIDLVITDYRMSPMMGDTLVDRLLEIKKSLPIIMLSGDAKDSICEQTAAKLSAFIQKPFQIEILLKAVDDAIAKEREK